MGIPVLSHWTYFILESSDSRDHSTFQSFCGAAQWSMWYLALCEKPRVRNQYSLITLIFSLNDRKGTHFFWCTFKNLLRGSIKLSSVPIGTTLQQGSEGPLFNTHQRNSCSGRNSTLVSSLKVQRELP